MVCLWPSDILTPSYLWSPWVFVLLNKLIFKPCTLPGWSLSLEVIRTEKKWIPCNAEIKQTNKHWETLSSPERASECCSKHIDLKFMCIPNLHWISSCELQITAIHLWHTQYKHKWNGRLLQPRSQMLSIHGFGTVSIWQCFGRSESYVNVKLLNKQMHKRGERKM